eukprot:TRINITY_DN15104_c0_g2_i2.p1 TRINITY_DN15104_c0_g2~~TRINITY_DN15104_c0_g2_i2.p1  ORF type:complete len:139 (+),score=6.22 TRINITY_DN15104_c0_g2_i2:626-1042(+)
MHGTSMADNILLIFSRSTWNQRLNFWLVAVFGLPNRVIGSDCDYGAHNVNKVRSNGPHFSINISRSKLDQRLKFGSLAVFSLFNASNGLDHHLGAENLKINETRGHKKKDAPIHCSWRVCPLQWILSVSIPLFWCCLK